MSEESLVPMALSVEKVRQEMLRGLILPRDIVNEALKTTAGKLKAKETKFFAHKGVVVSQKEVDDHTTQLAAADQIFSLAGLYARERMAAPQAPSVILEVDSKTGVIRLVVGSGGQALTAPLEGLVSNPSLVEASPAEAFIGAPAEVVALAVRPRKIPLPASFYRIILDEIVE